MKAIQTSIWGPSLARMQAFRALPARRAKAKAKARARRKGLHKEARHGTSYRTGSESTSVLRTCIRCPCLLSQRMSRVSRGICCSSTVLILHRSCCVHQIAEDSAEEVAIYAGGGAEAAAEPWCSSKARRHAAEARHYHCHAESWHTRPRSALGALACYAPATHAHALSHCVCRYRGD